ncbi:hypothetical protein M0R45_035840 [Rubus argutus]|uniref:Uncharacterized protein n=1 Tax=Rubus argutus TaxID=59490 RepID=A0AAW1VYW0_RUBAR
MSMERPRRVSRSGSYRNRGHQTPAAHRFWAPRMIWSSTSEDSNCSRKSFRSIITITFSTRCQRKWVLVLSRVKSNQTRVRTMQRSLSISSPREFKRDESEMRLERFKIRTIDLDDGVEQDGKDDKTKQGRRRF